MSSQLICWLARSARIKRVQHNPTTYCRIVEKCWAWSGVQHVPTQNRIEICCACCLKKCFEEGSCQKRGRPFLHRSLSRRQATLLFVCSIHEETFMSYMSHTRSAFKSDRYLVTFGAQKCQTWRFVCLFVCLNFMFFKRYSNFTLKISCQFMSKSWRVSVEHEIQGGNSPLKMKYPLVMSK